MKNSWSYGNERLANGKFNLLNEKNIEEIDYYIMNILFWNLKGNNVSTYIKQCLVENNIDIAMFCEHTGVDFKALEHDTECKFRFVESIGGCEKIALFVSNEISAEIKREQSRYVLYSVSVSDMKYIIVGVHLQDRHSSDAPIRIETIGRLMNDVKNLEQSSRCSNVIVIGDFNANPYDAELLQMNAFHAVLFKEVIKKSETRTVDGITYRRLYNPILNYLSEDTHNYGSYYYSSGSCTPIWHCLDQVLVSKKLVDSVASLQYIKSIGNIALIKKVQPNSAISDHLPLLVKFI